MTGFQRPPTMLTVTSAGQAAGFLDIFVLRSPWTISLIARSAGQAAGFLDIFVLRSPWTISLIARRQSNHSTS
jgi:hypothetical protein